MDGGRDELFLCWSQACVSQTCSSVAINLKPPPLKPTSNKVTVLQTKGEAGNAKGEEAGQEMEEMENKLFTLTANAPQRVVERKRGASALVRRPTDGMFERQGVEGWANPQGRRYTNLSSSLWLDLIYVATWKTLGRHIITEHHFASKSEADYVLLQSEC